eukprot:m.506960 g.506960  ORF g.506960 m.506960 type:complete len:284 (-) comp57375_c0_seq16:30-881(-)
MQLWWTGRSLVQIFLAQVLLGFQDKKNTINIGSSSMTVLHPSFVAISTSRSRTRPWLASRLSETWPGEHAPAGSSNTTRSIASSARRPMTASALPSFVSSAALRPTTAVTSMCSDFHTQAAFRAARLGFVGALHYLLSRDLVEVDAVDGLQRTLLIVAVLQKRSEVVEFLLEHVDRFDIDALAASGNTALHAAVNIADKAIVQLLLEYGANARATNPQCGNATPIDLAAMQDDEEMSTLLTTPPAVNRRAALPAASRNAEPDVLVLDEQGDDPEEEEEGDDGK